MLVNGHVGTATRIQPRRIENIAAVLGLIPGIGKKHVGQFIAGVFQHMPHVALALVVEKAVRGGIDVAQILGTEGFDDIAGLVVQLTEVVGMGLDSTRRPSRSMMGSSSSMDRKNIPLQISC